MAAGSSPGSQTAVIQNPKEREMKTLKTSQRGKRGAALVEYGLIVAGVALVCAAAVSVFGHKTAQMIGTSAAMLPGATDADNGTIVTGKVVRTTNDGGVITVDPGEGNTLENNLGIDTSDLVVDPSGDGGGG
jgi:Flp pilus assembly pilin Flp